MEAIKMNVTNGPIKISVTDRPTLLNVTDEPIMMSVTNGQIMSVADGPIMMVVTFTAEQWNGVTQCEFVPSRRQSLSVSTEGWSYNDTYREIQH